ncbi:hypothetical protein LXL04_034289 [Taraxacum kok-saghyz]
MYNPRKKWSELEEQTLLTKYSDLHTSGALAKLKTREKKFKPIAEHVNSQKIRVSDSEYNWKDGENHWENFMKYKEVFGAIELESRDHKRFSDVGGDLFGDSGFAYSRYGGDEFFGLGFDELQNDEDDDDEDVPEAGTDRDETDDSSSVHVKGIREIISSL